MRTSHPGNTSNLKALYVQGILAILFTATLPVSGALAQTSNSGTQLLPPTVAGTSGGTSPQLCPSGSLLAMLDTGAPNTNSSAINCVTKNTTGGYASTLDKLGDLTTNGYGAFYGPLYAYGTSGNSLNAAGNGSFGGNIFFGAGTTVPPTVSGGYAVVGRGPTSNFNLDVQDGTGRVNLLWNATDGYNIWTQTGAGNYLVSNEPAADFKETVTATAGAPDGQGAYFGFYSAPAGVANAAIANWIQIAELAGTKDIWLSPRGTLSDFYISKAGNVGINTTAPGATLDVNGTANVATTVTVGGATANSSTVSTANALATLAACGNGQALTKTGVNQFSCINVADLGNISATVPTCSVGQYLTFNGASFSCVNITVSTCPTGQAYTSINASGSLVCGTVATALPNCTAGQTLVANGDSTWSCQTSVNGQCNNTINGQSFSSTPTGSASSFCSSGTYSGLTTNATTWTWSCEGSGGGTTASCSANYVSPIEIMSMTYCQSKGHGDCLMGVGKPTHDAPDGRYVQQITPALYCESLNDGHPYAVAAFGGFEGGCSSTCDFQHAIWFNNGINWHDDGPSDNYGSMNYVACATTADAAWSNGALTGPARTAFDQFQSSKNHQSVYAIIKATPAPDSTTGGIYMTGNGAP